MLIAFVRPATCSEAANIQLPALQRLWEIANGHSGQCRVVAAFLLGLYNGQRFRFDLTDLRTLDTAIAQDCLQVLAMDITPAAEVHELLGQPSHVFEELATDWTIRDYTRGAA